MLKGGRTEDFKCWEKGAGGLSNRGLIQGAASRAERRGLLACAIGSRHSVLQLRPPDQRSYELLMGNAKRNVHNMQLAQKKHL